MKRFPGILMYMVFVLFFGQTLFSQVCNNARYRERVFPQVTKTADVQFATVQTLPAVYLNETQTVSQNLYMDIWQPTGDTLQKRPLVILAFGGLFYLVPKMMRIFRLHAIPWLIWVM